MKPISIKTKKIFCQLVLSISLLYVGNCYSQTVARANFTSNIISGCAPILVNFIDQSDGNPTEWKWDLGNGTISNLQNPSVTYLNSGSYTVKLSVKNLNNIDSIILTKYITVFSLPSVNFIADITTGCNPLTVNFTDHTNVSKDNIATWQWDFGDGILSAQQNPSHTFTAFDKYNISLKVVNNTGCIGSARKDDYIVNNTIAAGFTYKVSANCTPKNIIFQNTSTSNGTIKYLWNFGDGKIATIPNPTHSYDSGGVYKVKLIVNSLQGCTDSAWYSITVKNAVSANFTSNIRIACKAPVIATFSNSILSGNTYYWKFGDSTTSTVSNPIHTYTDTGNYTVKLVVKNLNGCSDSLTKINFIKIQKPLFAFNNIPDSSCRPFTKTISAILNPTSSIVQYHWDFGDGSTSTDQAPTHTFISPGYFTVKLIATAVTGCTDTISMPNAIRITSKPIATFAVSENNTCAKTELVFTNLSSGGANGWQWDFGDFANSTDQHPKHIYKDTGYRSVTLIAFNGGCSDTTIYKKFIYIKPAVAKYTFSINCAIPLNRTFSNYSIGATSFLWDFGDGTTSAQLSSVHIFPGQGYYTVKLTAFNDSTGCSFTSIKQVRVLDITPQFYTSDSVVCKNADITLTSPLSNLDVARFYWDFGDGTTKNTRNNTITHYYKTPGTYSLRLITIDFLNCRDTIVKPNYITVYGPKAIFGVAKNTCFGTSVIFADSSISDGTNPINKWIWEYGDGATDTMASGPYQHIYPVSKSYTVVMKLIDAMGCTDTFKLPTLLTISKVSARFYIADTFSCTSKQVKFICPYWTAGIAYSWSFGDGDSSRLQLPAHKFTAEGTYSVNLLVTDSNGCQDSSSMSNVLRVLDPKADFTMSDSFKTCPPLVVQFSSHSINTVEERWDFGDSSYSTAPNPSHFYTYPGVYTATLFAKGRGGCISQMQKTITVNGPHGTLTYDPLKLCKPYQVNFTAHAVDAVNYVWDFNDGITVSNTDSFNTHTYKDSGAFVPKILLVDNVGCKVAVTGKDTILNFFATAGFTFPDKTLCNMESMAFTNTSFTNDSLITYQWNFGDGTFSSQINPIHQFALPGLYFPTLTVTTLFGCTHQYKSPKPVKAAASSNIGLQMSANGCAPLNVVMSGVINTTDTAAIKWQWSMGNGNNFNIQLPPVQPYSNVGKYNVTLTATNSNGCIKTISKIVEAYGAPQLTLTNDSIICKGQSILLQASGAASYTWYPTINLSNINKSDVVAKPAVSICYKVTGASVYGCTAVDSVNIKVKQPFKINYSKSAILCAGQTKRLQANGAATYTWSPSSSLNNAAIANPEATPDSTTNYRVIGTDDKGCFQDTGFVSLLVYPFPTVDAGIDKTITVGSSVDLVPKLSIDVTVVNWTPTGEIFRNNQDAITVKPKTNTEYTVEVKNKGGCAAKDRVNVLVVCNGSNVFLPNLFSPNSDGVNDIFYPRGTGLYKIKTLKVFNRWGETVFAKSSFNANDPSAGWDGNYKGTKLNADTFIFIMDLICDNNSVLTLNGNVALVR